MKDCMFCLVFLIVVGAVAASPCVDPVPSDLENVTLRISPQDTIVKDDEILDCTYVPVGKTQHNSDYYIRRNPFNLYKGVPSYEFYMKDDDATRVELTTAFATQSDIDNAGLTENQINEHKNAKSLYKFGRGFARQGKLWTYEYGMFLPSSLLDDDTSSPQKGGIISQWHGVPDRTTVMDPSGTITKYNITEFNDNILSIMDFDETTGIDPVTGDPNGYLVDQGGYPPISLKVGDGYLYLMVRADHSRITNKTDRINISPPQTEKKISPYKTKEVSSPYQVPLADLPTDTWTDVKFDVVFSEWKEDGSGLKSNGTLLMYMNGTLVANFSGPLGNNDERAPYFKYGIYKPKKDGMRVYLASLNQYETSVEESPSVVPSNSPEVYPTISPTTTSHTPSVVPSNSPEVYLTIPPTTTSHTPSVVPSNSPEGYLTISPMTTTFSSHSPTIIPSNSPEGNLTTSLTTITFSSQIPTVVPSDSPEGSPKTTTFSSHIPTVVPSSTLSVLPTAPSISSLFIEAFESLSSLFELVCL